MFSITVYTARWSRLLILWSRFTLDRLRITLSNRDRTRPYKTFNITIDLNLRFVVSGSRLTAFLPNYFLRSFRLVFKPKNLVWHRGRQNWKKSLYLFIVKLSFLSVNPCSYQYLFDLNQKTNTYMVVRRGGQGGLLPPLAGRGRQKIVCF